MDRQITDAKLRRLERNAKIKRSYDTQMSVDGAMSSKVVASIAKFHKITTQAVYYILNGRKPPKCKENK